MMAGSSAAAGGRPHAPSGLNAGPNAANQPSVAANGSPAGARVGGRQGHSSHVAQAAAGALSSDISRRNPQDDYTLLQVWLYCLNLKSTSTST